MSTSNSEIERTVLSRQANVLGLTADDVILATFSYPNLTDTEVAALSRFRDLLDGFAQSVAHSFVAMSQPRQMNVAAVSDTLGQLKVQLQGPDGQAFAERITEATTAILGKTANDTDLENVRSCADSLSRVTFDRMLELSRRKGGNAWTSTSLTSC